MTAPIPSDEDERLLALHRYRVLDSEAEPEFDDFTALAAQICGAPISLVSLVDESRQWFKSKLGIPDTEMPRDVAFCAHAILGDGLMEVADAFDDERFRDNPLVTSEPHIRFYAGAPLVTPDGHKLGTLCVIDREPRRLEPEQREALARLGRQVVRLLELRRQTYLLENANARLRELEALRDSLVQMIVHDMRSQLGCVTGYLQLMAMGELPPAITEDLANATEAADELLEMIRSLLDVSRLEGGEMPLNLEEADLGNLLGDVIRKLAPGKNGRNISMVVPETGAVLRCDPELVSRVALNLVGNALKFTDPEAGKIEITAGHVDDGIEVAVADNGTGIPAEHQERIFDKFFQVRNHATTGHSSGLGLAFCKLAVEAHGGRIRVDSAPGQGSVFRFILPDGGAR